jgi:hypothetical protein
MPDGETGDVLRQRRIILIHEDAFIAQYLADVIAQSGGVVTRPIGPDVGAALADGAALVLSDTALHRDDLVRSATEQRLPFVIVRSAQRNATLATTDRVLTVPFAGFQVVDMLRGLLDQRETESPITAASGSHER